MKFPTPMQKPMYYVPQAQKYRVRGEISGEIIANNIFVIYVYFDLRKKFS